jgi:hypothetical protein
MTGALRVSEHSETFEREQAILRDAEAIGRYLPELRPGTAVYSWKGEWGAIEVVELDEEPER